MATKRKRVSRKKPITPPSYIRNVLRKRLWMWSRERKERLKIDGERCCACGATDGLNVHHLDGSGIDRIVALIQETLLCHPDRLRTLCHACHTVAHQQPHDYNAK